MGATDKLITIAKYPVIDFSKCTRCEKCIAICPTHAIIKTPNPNCAKCIKYCISMKVSCSPDNYVFYYDDCNFCGYCVAICPTRAINWFSPEEL
jgi:formate hydrogenlyase subunit 6/NADH:ubiquinone oxidoreductase subunit I